MQRSNELFSPRIEKDSLLRRNLPPFAAIRAFEAAARHLSVKDAAEELCLTPSAVSHQIKSLEEFLATGLFNRDGNRLTLTVTGRNYLGKLTGLLDTLDQTTRDAGNQKRELRVLCTPGFAARWLVPRLDQLEFGNEIRLRVSEGAPDTNFDRNDADVVIQWGESPVADVVTEPLMSSARYPVISPELKHREKVHHPTDLLRVTLLHDEVMDAWSEWFQAAGVGLPDLPRGPRFPNCEIATTAAERGQGVALAYDAMVRSTVASGSLVRLFKAVTLPVVIYSVAYPETHRDHDRIQVFRDWLFSQVSEDGDLARANGAAAE